MLIAQKPQTEASWTPVMGASVLFAPITRPMLRRARRAALEALGVEGAGGGETRSVEEQMEELGDALSYALIMAGAQDWRDVGRGVLDDDGQPVLDADQEPTFEMLEFTSGNLSAVLADALAFEAFDAAYVVPYVQRERERAAPGKGSPLSPNGTGTKVKAAADTAASPARARAASVKSARTSSTKRKATAKKQSGTS